MQEVTHAHDREACKHPEHGVTERLDVARHSTSKPVPKTHRYVPCTLAIYRHRKIGPGCRSRLSSSKAEIHVPYASFREGVEKAVRPRLGLPQDPAFVASAPTQGKKKLATRVGIWGLEAAQV